MLVDEVTIKVIAGNGGDGSSSLWHDGQTAKGGPDGGNGGNGGSVYFIGVTDLSALSAFRFKKVLRAENGEKGAKQNKFGRNAKDLIIQVPIGTRITEVGSSRIHEIIDTKTPLIVAQGGKGGRGNKELKALTQHGPRSAEVGTIGATKVLLLELLLIADVGLIGLPNVGKSSLLSVLTNASPKIANYNFTTLEPNLGMTDAITIADIPGLIDGASSGKGLGIKFLKHIEKTRLLLHCIDVTTNDLLANYRTIHEELSNYDSRLLEKDEIILLTKIDLIDEKSLKEKIKLLKSLHKDIQTVSVYDDESITGLKKYLQTYIH